MCITEGLWEDPTATSEEVSRRRGRMRRGVTASHLTPLHWVTSFAMSTIVYGKKTIFYIEKSPN
jgi:hypothetical protein